jgi:hypothetical protein
MGRGAPTSDALGEGHGPPTLVKLFSGRGTI